MKKQYLCFIIPALLIISCNQKHTPKPRGYFRIDFPGKDYHRIENKFPYSFEIPAYSEIQPDRLNPGNPNWINIEVPANKAEVHISYYEINGTKPDKRRLLAGLMEESRELAYKHSIKANAIDEQLFVNPANKVYGIVYKIAGNAASPMQFFLTDSTRHFLRGALYIREVPDIDSIKPVIDFLEPDIVRLIETTYWE